MKTIIPADLIIKTVAEYYHFETEIITCPRRLLEYIKAKHIAIYFCRKYTDLSLSGIGKNFKSRIPNMALDHATVLNAIRSVNDQLDCYASYRKEVNEIDRKLKRKAVNLIEEIEIIESEVYMENDFYLNQ